MKLRTVLYLLIFGFSLMMICILLTAITHQTLFGYTGAVIGVLALVFGLTFFRCPHCNGFLGKLPVEYCPHCGSKLDW